MEGLASGELVTHQQFLDRAVGASLSLCADDMWKFIWWGPRQGIPDLAQMSERANALPDQALAEIGCKQNVSKQEITSMISGPGSGTYARDLRECRGPPFPPSTAPALDNRMPMIIKGPPPS
eukprot:1429120-Pyramimonas_sp.AAC.1